MNLIYIKICFTFANEKTINERYALFSKNTANHSTTGDKHSGGSCPLGMNHPMCYKQGYYAANVKIQGKEEEILPFPWRFGIKNISLQSIYDF